MEYNTEMVTGNGIAPILQERELREHVGESVALHGMIYKVRAMSGFAFVLLRTARCILQCIHTEKETGIPLNELKENMSVELVALVKEDARSRSGFELHIGKLKILSAPSCEAALVINGKELSASLDTLLDHRALTLRNEKQRAIFKIQEGLCRGFREFFHKHGFTEIHTPKIVSGSAEGGANVFSLDYFGRAACLAQSPQFYKQMMVGVYERVFEVGPVFRAEKHDTSRHINEYTSVDMEMGFLEGFEELMRIETSMIANALSLLEEEYAYELTLLGASLPQAEEIPSLDFIQAKELVSRLYARPVTDERDLDPEEEKLLCEWAKKETGADFIFITRYPSEKRPFYAMDCADQPALTESFDLLFRGLEVTTGGQRIHSYEQQVEKLRARGLEPAHFASYLSAHENGLPPHGGFGLGLERFTARLLELPNIRNATLFPRDTRRLDP